MLFEFYLNSVKCILSETKFLSNVYEMHISGYFNECTRALVERCGGGWRQVVIGKNWPLIFRYMKKNSLKLEINDIPSRAYKSCQRKI